MWHFFVLCVVFVLSRSDLYHYALFRLLFIITLIIIMHTNFPSNLLHFFSLKEIKIIWIIIILFNKIWSITFFIFFKNYTKYSALFQGIEIFYIWFWNLAKYRQNHLSIENKSKWWGMFYYIYLNSIPLLSNSPSNTYFSSTGVSSIDYLLSSATSSSLISKFDVPKPESNHVPLLFNLLMSKKYLSSMSFCFSYLQVFFRS